MAAVRYVYTSTFAICLWLDGVNRTPVLLFTFDPAFDPNGPLAKEVAEWCRRNRIDRSRIYFLRSKKHYCPESKDQTDEFRRLYQNQLLGARVLHDNGNSLKERKASRFEGDCERAVFLPSAPHGELSVCDNCANAVAKNAWVAERNNSDPEWIDTLKLLRAYDRLDPAAIRRMGTRNFLLDQKQPTRIAVEEILKGNDRVEPKRVRLFEDYRAAYYSFLAEREASGVHEFVAEDGRQVDGPYWASNKKKF